MSQQSHITGDRVCLKPNSRSFPGGPVIENLPSSTGQTSLIPGQGTKIPHATGQQASPASNLEKPVHQTESRRPATETQHHQQGLPSARLGKTACSAGGPGVGPGLGSPGEGKATHSRILAWKIQGLYSPWGHKESDTNEQLSLTAK